MVVTRLPIPLACVAETFGCKSIPKGTGGTRVPEWFLFSLTVTTEWLGFGILRGLVTRLALTLISLWLRLRGIGSNILVGFPPPTLVLGGGCDSIDMGGNNRFLP